MIVTDFGCLLIESTRTRAYIQKLVAHNLLPEQVIFLDRKRRERTVHPSVEEAETADEAILHAFYGRKYFQYSNTPSALDPLKDARPRAYATFDPECPVMDTVRAAGLDVRTVHASSINDEAVVAVVAEIRPTHVLFTGGGILRHPILSQGKRFIHIHPGWIPDVRGSMAVEWSVLTGQPCAASAFFMVPKIDEGDIIARRRFDPPEIEHRNVAPLYSSHIRSDLLIDVVRAFVETGTFEAEPQNPDEGTTYYKMHPILNNVVFERLLDEAAAGG